MIDNKTLVNNGFVRKKIEIDEYGHTLSETRWYYGPYLYLRKKSWGDTYNLFEKYSSDSNNNWANYLTVFDGNEDIENVRQYCKDWYMELNKRLIKEIEVLQDKRDEIMNFVF